MDRLLCETALPKLVRSSYLWLPLGHQVIALSKGQMHTVLCTFADESHFSSFMFLKYLLLQAANGKVITKERCRHVRRTGWDTMP